jgi:hypothetical protein
MYADKLRDAFSASGKSNEENRHDAIEYMKALRETWKDVSASVNRTLFIMLGLAAVFELITTGGSKEVNIAGFVFDDLATIQAILPVLVAYLYLEVITSYMRFDDLSTMHRELMRIANPALESQGLDIPLTPSSIALIRGSMVTRFSLSDRLRWMANPISALIFITLLLPIGFEVHAYYSIFKISGYTVLNWATFGMTLALVAGTLGVLSAWIFDD